MNSLGDAATKPRSKDTAARMSRFDALPDVAILSGRDLCFLLGCHRQTLWRKVREGHLPKPELVLGMKGWRVQTIRRILK